jgi:mannose-6-phosphate isomerase-like protein (cupin superfamily)
MKNLLVALLTLASVFLGNLRADDAAYWSNDSLQGYTKKLAPNVNPDHFALERLGDFGSHYVLVVYREGNGPAESHDTETDFYVIQSGEATLYTGGEIVDGKQTEPGEIRGSSIKGGKKTTLKAGDTVNIPPKTSHQVVLEAGKKITYMILKIRAK